MELLNSMPLYVVQWLLQEYMPEEDDSDYTPKQLLNYDPRGSFADNLSDMFKEDSLDALGTIIERLYLLPSKETLEGYPPPSLTAYTGDQEYAMKRIRITDMLAAEQDYEEALDDCEEEIDSLYTRGLNGSYDEYIDEHSDADPGL